MEKSPPGIAENETAAYPSRGQRRWCCWLKRFGVVGFIFFLAKGMLWLILPALLFHFGFGS